MKILATVPALITALSMGAPPLAAQQTAAFVPVTDAMLRNPHPAGWLMSPELHPGRANNLFVFALPDRGPME